MLFLKDPKLKLGYQHDTFPYATKKEVQSAAVRLMDRLFSVQEESLHTSNASSVSDGSEPNIDSFIEKETKSKCITNIKPNVKSDLKTYEGRGELTPNLKLLQKALHTMKATSVASESEFSKVVYLMQKGRTLLSDEALDNLCFLKGVFHREKLK